MSTGDGARCKVCGHSAATRNNEVRECSHVDCPHRRKAWSERPDPEERHHYQWGLDKRSQGPLPLDRVIKKGGRHDA